MKFLTGFFLVGSALALIASTADEQAFTARAQSSMAHAKEAVAHAQKPADLDGVIAELQTLSLQSNRSGYADASVAFLLEQINAAQQFAARWQDYLSASATGQTEEARQALQQILNNQQLTGLGFIPRSEILARLDGRPPADQSAAPSSSGPNPQEAADAITAKVEKVDQVGPALDKIFQLPNMVAAYGDLYDLEHKRVDTLAGLPVTLDLKKVMEGREYGDDISRIEGMELLAILPFYFETARSNPPKAGETVSGYLDRLITEADASDNLGLLQRALWVKVGLSEAGNGAGDQITESHASCESFLAGLTQEAAGQYADAVVSYERALAGYDSLLPAKVVGDRLAAIKADHPSEFDQGLANFQNPPQSFDPRFPVGWRRPGFPPFPGPTVAVLPIPTTVSLPSRTEIQPSVTKPFSTDK